MMAKSCSNLDGNTCSPKTIFDENQTYEPLLPEDLVISKSNYDTLQNVQNAKDSRRIEQKVCTKEHNQTSERFTILDNNTAEVKQDDYYIEIQTQTSCNFDIYESIDARELNPTHCASTHLTNSCYKRFTFKGRRRKCFTCVIFGFLLAGVIAGVIVFLLLKNNSQDPDKQNIQAQVTPCTGSPCLNHGECIIQKDTYQCDCPVGFNGSECQETPCSKEPCFYNGTCTVLGNLPICACKEGYNGSSCEVTPCHSLPCSNGGKCAPAGNGFVCSCPSGYFGNQVTPCHSSPCMNGGTCKPTGRSFVYSCPTGYGGKQCQITPCHSSPCWHGGRCTQTISSFVCSCLTGYSGNRCQIRPTCPSGWKMNENICYLFNGVSINWYSAKIVCYNLGSMLAEVTSRSKMTFLRTNAKKYGKTFWLGGSDRATESVWVWTTSGQRFTVTDWHTRTIREPNNQDGNEDCLSIHKELDYEWNDDKCSNSYSFICEKPLN